VKHVVASGGLGGVWFTFVLEEKLDDFLISMFSHTRKHEGAHAD